MKILSKLDTIWPYGYLAGPGDLDKSLQLCVCVVLFLVGFVVVVGFFFVCFVLVFFLRETLVTILSQPCVAWSGGVNLLLL